ncbi:MAG: acetate--CoA ligase family protein [Anaerolineales bacterium]|nr:acetate--CoA ligase family protein [Anaerolineales bacterium]
MEKNLEKHLILEPEAISLLTGYGIPYPDYGFAQSGGEAVELADRLGYPVVLKIVSPHVLHKSDVGGVLVNIADAEAVLKGYDCINHNVQTAIQEAQIRGVLVCRQASEGQEVIVGALDDVTFGPTVMFGLGGIFAEILKDVTFRVAPLRRSDAEEMVKEIRGYALLAGARGSDRLDIEALVDLLMAVSQLAMENRHVRELDLNPVRVYSKGLLALDARILIDDNENQV